MDSQVSMNQILIEKLNDLLEQNYQNEDFGVSELASESGISKSQLVRKLQSLRGVTSSQYINLFRLQKGYVLVRNNAFTVSEIAYTVGFGSPSYFIKCFHEYYNCSPSELKLKSDEELQVNSLGEKMDDDGASMYKRLLNRWSLKVQCPFLELKIIIPIVVFGIVTIILITDLSDLTKTKQTKSIVVLPIEIMNSQLDHNILSQGIQEGLIGSLGKINGFHVFSRGSTLKYNGAQKSLDNIAKELDVDFVVVGKIDHTSNDSIFFSLKVFKEDNLKQESWSYHYHTSLEDILTVQNDVSQSIGVSTGVVLNTSAFKNPTERRKLNIEAYKNYLRGMYYLHKSTQKDYDKGLSYLHKSLDEDPAEPLAYAGLAYGYVILGHSASQNKEVFMKAKLAANRAIELDPNLLEAYASLASINIYHDWNWKAAEKTFKYILEQNASMPSVHYDYAWYSFLIGNKEEAIKHHELAKKLDPFNAKYIAWTGWLYASYGMSDMALEQVIEALRISPNNAIAHFTRGYIYQLRNNDTEALKSYKQLYDLHKGWAAPLGGLYAEMGNYEMANSILEEVKKWPLSSWKNWTLANLYASLNQVDKAIEMLNTEPRHAFVAWASTSHAFKGIKDTKEFKKFQLELNLPN